MTTLKVLLEYDGTRYSGWQEQKNARTVMGAVRQAASQVLPAVLEMQGAGRTDAGVHALGQVMHIKTRSDLAQPLQLIQRRINDLLPADIAILDIERTHASFHARHDALSRVYLYQISTRKQAFMKKYVWWIKETLDIDAISRAAAMILGRHDFVCFRAQDPSRREESSIVTVGKTQIETEEDLITFRIEASHFLWRMVRRLTGGLVKIGKGELRDQDFQALLAGRCDPNFDVAAWTAPASGLFLEQIRYGWEAQRGKHPRDRP
jgi:tRNA pseudouridine38-40 synthase